MKLTYAQFVDLGERMRLRQDAYFQHRNQSDLVRSKELEREFDKACEDFHQGDLLQDA